MSRHNKGTRNENYQRAAELQELPAHVHTTATEGREKADHQSGHELSRNAMEHSREGQEFRGQAPEPAGATFGHQDIADLAHYYWLQRGSPEGSPELDWFQAVQELRHRAQNLHLK